MSVILKACLLMFVIAWGDFCAHAEPDPTYFGSISGRFTFDKSPLPQLPRDNNSVEFFGEREFVPVDPQSKFRSEIYARYLIRTSIRNLDGTHTQLDKFLVELQLSPFANSDLAVGSLELWRSSDAQRVTLMSGIKIQRKAESMRGENSAPSQMFIDITEQIQQTNLSPNEAFRIVLRSEGNNVPHFDEIFRFQPFSRAGRIPSNPHFMSRFPESAKRLEVPAAAGLPPQIKTLYLPAHNGILESLEEVSPLRLEQSFEFENGSKFSSTLVSSYVPSLRGRARGHYVPSELQLHYQVSRPRRAEVTAFKLYTRLGRAGDVRVERVPVRIPFLLQPGSHSLSIALNALESHEPRAWHLDDAYVLVIAIVSPGLGYVAGVLDQGPVLFVDPEPIGGIFLF